jgi:hypothetical protein
MNEERGLTRTGVITIAVVCIAGLGVLVTLFLETAQPVSRERNAAMALKTISAAQADFRANDRDGNGVTDYWTGDVKSLYTLRFPESPLPGAKEATIRLIHEHVAAADADETMVPAGGRNNPLSSFTRPASRSGYWFAAMTADLSEGAAKAMTYRQNTGGKPDMGKCHHESKYGFVAFPNSPSEGKMVFIVNEDNTLYRTPLSAPARTGTAVPPGLGSVNAGYLNWPEAGGMKESWWKLD